jgi:hypothetical protein
MLHTEWGGKFARMGAFFAHAIPYNHHCIWKSPKGYFTWFFPFLDKAVLHAQFLFFKRNLTNRMSQLTLKLSHLPP